MKILKKLCCMMIILGIVSSFAVNVSAQEYTVKKIGEKANKYFSTVNYNSSLAKDIANAWDTYQSSVSILKYKIKASVFLDTFLTITDLYPEYFYVDLYNTTYSINSSNYVEKIKLAYLYSPSTCNQQRAKLEAAVSNILSKMNSIARQEDKVVFLHDYITAHNAYDYKGVTGSVNAVDDYSFTAYGCLVDNVSVCQGMSDAFLLVCKRAGITSAMANSDDMVHAWNFVKIGDEYYHLDITWDDDCSNAGLNFDGESFLDMKGFVSHKYFLKSDEQMLNLEHHSWDQTYIADDSVTYNNYYWSDVYSQIFFIKGYQYFIKNSKLIKRNFITGEEKVLFTIENDNFSYNKKNYAWYSRNAILSYNYEDNFLLINLSDGAYAYNLYSGEITKVFEYSGNGYIGGMIFDGNILSYDAVGIKDDKYYQLPAESVKITLPEYNILYGDVNVDNEMNISDLLEFRKFLANEENSLNEFCADVNEDNFADLKDLLLMIRKLAGYNISFGG